ncbi:hypothetical protein HDV00_009036 [Rhizophlyctis rosea]|nr:hypothetical protein HDV00_009036 [Rhizophlyctis rosea]
MAFSEFIGEVRALQKRPKNEEALQLLKRIASMVKPIMRKRGWKVGLLVEFFPNNPNLLGLNVNRGQQIKIRLRPASDDARFLDFESLVGTMLHELTHIVHGPHDAKFYKLLDELYSEYESNFAAGYKGEGFEGPGARVGQGVSHDLPPHLARQAAIDAAEKRRKRNDMMTPSGGRRLGGERDSKMLEKVLGPGQLAAMAAERRAAQDRIWCGSGEGEEAGGASGSGSGVGGAGVDMGDDGVVLVGGKTKPSVKAPLGKVGAKDVPVVVDAVSIAATGQLETPRRKAETGGPSSGDGRKRKLSTSEETWTCPSCTLINAPLVLQCAVCWTLRPHAAADFETLDDTASFGGGSTSKARTKTPQREDVSTGGWLCPRCTLMNESQFRMCSACGYLRPL